MLADPQYSCATLYMRLVPFSHTSTASHTTTLPASQPPPWRPARSNLVTPGRCCRVSPTQALLTSTSPFGPLAWKLCQGRGTGGKSGPAGASIGCAPPASATRQARGAGSGASTAKTIVSSVPSRAPASRKAWTQASAALHALAGTAPSPAAAGSVTARKTAGAPLARFRDASAAASWGAVPAASRWMRHPLPAAVAQTEAESARQTGRRFLNLHQGKGPAG